jgi:hypothetical protein
MKGTIRNQRDEEIRQFIDAFKRMSAEEACRGMNENERQLRVTLQKFKAALDRLPRRDRDVILSFLYDRINNKLCQFSDEMDIMLEVQAILSRCSRRQ